MWSFRKCEEVFCNWQHCDLHRHISAHPSSHNDMYYPILSLPLGSLSQALVFILRQCLNKRSAFLKRVGSVDGEETLALQPTVSVFWCLVSLSLLSSGGSFSFPFPSIHWIKRLGICFLLGIMLSNGPTTGSKRDKVSLFLGGNKKLNNHKGLDCKKKIRSI